MRPGAWSPRIDRWHSLDRLLPYSMYGSKELMLLLSGILIQLLDVIVAQMESSMGMRSNLDESPQKQLNQCPGEWQWACRNGECIARYDICDGIPQCSDGSDEWNCDQWRSNQNQAYEKQREGQLHPAVTTQASTTTATADAEYIVLPSKETYLALIAFAVLAVVLVIFIRRRARIRALARNRRGNLLQADSDEDDILISSMYS